MARKLARAAPLPRPPTRAHSFFIQLPPLNIPAAQVKSLTGGRWKARLASSHTAPLSGTTHPSSFCPYPIHIFAAIRPAAQRRASAHFFKVTCRRFARDLGKGIGRLPYRSA
jgi:hypothetical protein